jgi:hypothetical protein
MRQIDFSKMRLLVMTLSSETSTVQGFIQAWAKDSIGLSQHSNLCLIFYIPLRCFALHCKAGECAAQLRAVGERDESALSERRLMSTAVEGSHVDYSKLVVHVVGGDSR